MTIHHDPLTGEVGFATSGHAGVPVTWFRTAAQLRAEVAVVGKTLIGPVDRVVNFAPPGHLYGYLFGRVLPELLGIPVQQLWQDPLALPDLRGGQRTLLVCLPSSWQVLRKVVDRTGELSGSIALHGTGPATPATSDVLSLLAGNGFRALEIFGSTETGGIASRAMEASSTPRTAWCLLPDVDLVTDLNDEGFHLLHVRSPRLARREDTNSVPESLQLSDMVHVVGDRRFEFVGRSSQLIKINGKRCDLAHVEAAITAAMPGLDVVCVPVEDLVRGEHYELFHCTKVPDESVDALHASVSAVLGDLPMPRMFHHVTHIPRTITGKVKVDRLYALAAVSSRRRG